MFEFKYMDAPTLTRSMSIAMHDLKLDALYVAYPGARRYSPAERNEAVPLGSVRCPVTVTGDKPLRPGMKYKTTA